MQSEPSGELRPSRTFSVFELIHEPLTNGERARLMNLAIKVPPWSAGSESRSKKNRKTDPMLVVFINAGLRMDEDFLPQRRPLLLLSLNANGSLAFMQMKTEEYPVRFVSLNS